MPPSLKSLTGLSIEEVHTAYHEEHDTVTFVLSGKRRLELPIDVLIPLGDDEWDDYWTDFDDFVADGPDDIEPESIEGEVITLAELLETKIGRVRTGLGSGGGRFVLLEVDEHLSLLMPAAAARLDGVPLSESPDFDSLVDDEVSRCVLEEPE